MTSTHLFIMVDWSASSQPTLGADSIWISAAHCQDSAPIVMNISTRNHAVSTLSHLISTAIHEHTTVHLGVDFALSFPHEFARDLLGASQQQVGDTPEHTHKAIWALIGDLVHDNDANVNNRFSVAAHLNALVGDLTFWGSPVAFARSTSTLTRHKPHSRYVRLRRCDLEAQKRVGGYISSPFQLLGIGSVGSQSLLGIAALYQLQQSLKMEFGLWPYQTERQEVIVYEVWPSLYLRSHPEQFTANMVKDELQVRTALSAMMRRLLNETAIGVHVTNSGDIFEDGWIFDVPLPRFEDPSIPKPMA